mmetsp:Transcript_31757/g.76892  ORF Transcript_31757/g.76892 Transcript_31757/m.76892 type:complete len:95 (+) Transcript_31757:650-934(+)
MVGHKGGEGGRAGSPAIHAVLNRTVCPKGVGSCLLALEVQLVAMITVDPNHSSSSPKVLVQAFFQVVASVANVAASGCFAGDAVDNVSATTFSI